MSVSQMDRYYGMTEEDVERMSVAEKLAMFKAQMEDYSEDARKTLYKRGSQWTSDFTDEITDILHDESKPLKTRLFAMLAEIGYLHLLIQWGGTIDPARN